MSTIILCLSSESFDERFYLIATHVHNTNDSIPAIEEMVRNKLKLNVCKFFSIDNLISINLTGK